MAGGASGSSGTAAPEGGGGTDADLTEGSDSGGSADLNASDSGGSSDGGVAPLGKVLLFENFNQATLPTSLGVGSQAGGAVELRVTGTPMAELDFVDYPLANESVSPRYIWTWPRGRRATYGCPLPRAVPSTHSAGSSSSKCSVATTDRIREIRRSVSTTRRRAQRHDCASLATGPTRK